jgi:hypothetical protein
MISSSGMVSNPFFYASLIGDDHHALASTNEERNGLSRAGTEMDIFPSRHVLSLNRFAIDHAVTIQKNCSFHQTAPRQKDTQPPKLDIRPHAVILKNVL